jgi:hypothetical protein
MSNSTNTVRSLIQRVLNGHNPSLLHAAPASKNALEEPYAIWSRFRDGRTGLVPFVIAQAISSVVASDPHHADRRLARILFHWFIISPTLRSC